MTGKTIRRLCGLLLCLTFLIGGCAGEEAEIISENPGVRVTFLDVGKGDAILVETTDHNILIDSGYDKTSQVILNYLKEKDIQCLDYLILTHFDKDHVGGADKIIEEVEILEVLQPDYESESNQYLEYAEALDNLELQPVIVTESIRFTLDGADFLIYPSQQKVYEKDNDFSLVVSLRYQKRSFLFAGDSQEVRINELLAQNEFELSHDVLKIPHHGREENNTEEFLKAVSPRAAVITCEEEKMIDERIQGVLDELGIKTYLTSKGAVICLCDGESIKIYQ